MARKKTFSDADAIAAYQQHKNIWVAAPLIGTTGQCLHKRLQSLGVPMTGSGIRWTKADTQRLIKDYPTHSHNGTLAVLASDMGRTRQFICRKAKTLGLTSQSRERPYLATWKYIEEEQAEKVWAQFKKSSLGLGQFCKANGIDDLGFSNAMKRFFADEWEYVIESKAPKQTKYRLGRQVEYSVRDDLKKRGYFALRSPRSGGIADLIALKKGCVLLVQCKRSMALGVSEWNQLFDLADSVGAVPLLAGRPTGRGLIYMKLDCRKDGSKRRQPMNEYEP